ncbi:hypothetical protein B0H13DRAFT_1876975 [Mycena leptocephala]|nr:hypothetical protein B0H13DRAFT_1876975 [Mycena leptocephala]
MNGTTDGDRKRSIEHRIRRRTSGNEKLPSENHPSRHSRVNGSTKDEAGTLGAVFGLCGQHADKRVLCRSSKGRFLAPTIARSLLPLRDASKMDDVGKSGAWLAV